MPWTDRPGGTGNGSGNNGGGPWGQPPSNGDNGNGQRRPGDRPTADLEELLRSGRDRFRRSGGGGGRGGSGQSPELKMPSGPILALFGVILLILWALSGVYTVPAGSRGVVTTFGQYTSISGPGLRVHFPWPIQSREIVPVDLDQDFAIGGGRSVSMLTSDLNIVDVQLTGSYRVRSDAGLGEDELPNAAKFVFNIEAPAEVVDAAAESALRQVVGESEFAPLITTERPAAAQRTQQILQEILDSYNSGIEVIRVNLGSATPPAPVLPAQADVIDARSDREREINEATQYANQNVPVAEGRARQIILEAEGYAQSTVREAQGAANRFNDIYVEYAIAPDVTRQRIYLETMEDVLPRLNMIIMGDEAGGALPYLNLNELSRESQAARERRAVTGTNSTSGGR